MPSRALAVSYSNTTQATVCHTCEAGSYSNTTQSTLCLACQADSYFDITQSALCLACQAGSLSNIIQVTVCIAFQSGSYSNTAQATVCLVFSKVSYSNASQASQCLACQAGFCSRSAALVLRHSFPHHTHPHLVQRFLLPQGPLVVRRPHGSFSTAFCEAPCSEGSYLLGSEIYQCGFLQRLF